MDEPITLPYDDPSFVANPYPFYQRLREKGRVVRLQTRFAPAWLITRYDDVLAALSDPRLSSDFHDATDPHLADARSADKGALGRCVVRVNPPDHTRLRRLLSTTFTARRIAHLSPRIQEITDRLLDAVAPAGHVDLVDEFALPLTVTVISELIGVPEEDRAEFREWSDAMLFPRSASPDRVRQEEAVEKIQTYLEDLASVRQTLPGDGLLSALIAARDEDQSLDQEELIANVFLMLVAGYVTSVDLIGNSIVGLLTHPEQLELLRGDPGLLPNAIDEFLRYETPSTPGIARFALEDIEIGDVTIPRGAVIMVGIADRDPARFPDPDRLDITRAGNAHLAFGHGPHYCIGAPLARLQARIAIDTVFRRLPDLALAIPYPRSAQFGPAGGPERTQPQVRASPMGSEREIA